MPRGCFLLSLGAAWLVSVALGFFAGGESTLLWWHKALYAMTGAVLALIVLRFLPADASQREGETVDRGQPSN